MKFIIFLLIAVTGLAQASEVNIKVIALFSGKAMLQVNGQQKIVRNGETFEGVFLKSASGRGAIVEIEGEEKSRRS